MSLRADSMTADSIFLSLYFSVHFSTLAGGDQSKGTVDRKINRQKNDDGL